MNKRIMYERGGVIHECEGARLVPFDPGTFVLWTKCGKDVPAGKGFTNPDERTTCPQCASPRQGTGL